MTLTDFPWKAPLSDSWNEYYNEARDLVRDHRPETAGARLAELAHRLSVERLGPLEQLRLEKLAAKLWPLRDDLAPLRPLRVGLVGNRTLKLLEAPLRVAGLSRLLLIEPATAPIDSAHAVAHGRHTAFDEPPDIVVICQDSDAYRPTAGLLDPAAEAEALEQAEQQLRSLSAGIAKTTGASVVIATIPLEVHRRIGSGDRATVGTPVRFVDGVNRIIADGAVAGDWLMWDLAGLAADVGHFRWFDPLRFFESKLAFSPDLGPLVCDSLARLLAACAGKMRRALVLDLDNTVWGGVIGDDGLEGIAIGQGSVQGEAFLRIQELALELRRRGVVLCVCSKNDDATARAPFREHPDMLLRESDIAVFQAGWDDKATSISAIAEALRLGLESFVFVDDNPAERARVRAELPFVAVPELGEQAADYADLIVAAGAFEHLPVNRDDLGRAQSYQAEAKRADVLARVGNYEEYLQSLKMMMQLSHFDKLGAPRIAQLIGKSNQFNVTTRRYNQTAVEAMIGDPKVVSIQARLSDTFSDHGMIGVVIARAYDHVWVIDTWLQSCRILERGVEQAIINQIVEMAAAQGVERIYGQYKPSPRNRMVADLFLRLGFSLAEAPSSNVQPDDADGDWFVLDVAQFSPHDGAIDVSWPACIVGAGAARRLETL